MAVKLKQLHIDNPRSPLEGALSISLDYAVTENIPGAYWQLEFIVDFAAARKTVVLARSSTQSLSPEQSYSVQLGVKSIEFSGFSADMLANVAVVSAKLIASATNSVKHSVNMVTEVTKQQGALIRSIYHPSDASQGVQFSAPVTDFRE